MDEPYFPKPDGPYRARESSGQPTAPEAPEPTPRRVVVSRPEPLPEASPDGERGPKTALTKEEIKALLATSEVNKRSRLGRAGRRVVILVPLGLLEVALDLVFHSVWVSIIFGVIGVGLFGWSVSPLFRRSDWA